MKKLDVKLIEGNKVYNAVLTIKESSFLIASEDSYMVKVLYNSVKDYQVDGNRLVISMNNNDKVNLESEFIDEIVKTLKTKQVSMQSNKKTGIKSGNNTSNVTYSEQVGNISNNQVMNAGNNKQIVKLVSGVIGLIFCIGLFIYAISDSNPFGDRAGDAEYAKDKALTFFQAYNTTASQLQCEPKELVEDIILVKCTTTDDLIINMYNSSTLWYGYLESADGRSFWQYGSSSREEVIEHLNK